MGNMGSEARMIVRNGGTIMAAFSMATQDSVQNEEGNWQIQDAVFHNIITFDGVEIQKLKPLKIGSPLKIIGSISYKKIEAIAEKGKAVTIKEAAIIAHSIEQMP